MNNYPIAMQNKGLESLTSEQLNELNNELLIHGSEMGNIEQIIQNMGVFSEKNS